MGLFKVIAHLAGASVSYGHISSLIKISRKPTCSCSGSKNQLNINLVLNILYKAALHCVKARTVFKDFGNV